MRFAPDPLQAEQLRNAGLKVTPGRMVVYWLLTQARTAARHLTAEDLFRGSIEAGSRASPATIYRALADFERAGLIDRRHFIGIGFAYELASATSHDHLINLDTGDVSEFSDEVIEKRLKKLAAEKNLDLVKHALTVFVRRKQ